MVSTDSLPTWLPSNQAPRIRTVPDYGTGVGDEAVELAAMAGLHLDPWEQLVLRDGLGIRADGKWAAFELGLAVSRQNGKGSIFEARELAGLYLLGERLLIHSAHQFDTSLEGFRRLLSLIDGKDELRRRVKRVSRSHGEEGIELTNGQRIRFRTRTKGGGRGFTSDWLGLDEAMILPEAAHGAILPTLSARPNPQVWYAGSVVDQWVHDHGVVFSRVRERGIRGAEALAYLEWSAHVGAPADDDPELLEPDQALDEELWQQANPGHGIRISTEHIGREQRSMLARNFAVERLGVGDWPDTTGEAERTISAETWSGMIDTHSQLLDPVCLAFDVSPDRSWASISAAGHREDELGHIEVIDRRRGTGWVVDRLLELNRIHRPMGIITDGVGPGASLVRELEEAGLEVTVTTARELAQACGVFYDGCEEASFRHLGTNELMQAVQGAKPRALGDAWAWSRKNSAIDITPLVSCTLALWGALEEGQSVWGRRHAEGAALL